MKGVRREFWQVRGKEATSASSSCPTLANYAVSDAAAADGNSNKNKKNLVHSDSHDGFAAAAHPTWKSTAVLVKKSLDSTVLANVRLRPSKKAQPSTLKRPRPSKSSGSMGAGAQKRRPYSKGAKRKSSSSVLAISTQNFVSPIIDLDTFLTAAACSETGVVAEKPTSTRRSKSHSRHTSGCSSSNTVPNISGSSSSNHTARHTSGSSSNQSGRHATKRVPVHKPLSERIVCHGRNWVPVNMQDGENVMDCDYSWMKEFNRRNLDEFTDVNPSEKVLLNMWNNFIYGIHGRSFINLPYILERFISTHGEDIWKQNLLGNFQLMVSSMQHRGILSQLNCYRILIAMQRHIVQVAGAVDTATTASAATQASISVGPPAMLDDFPSPAIDRLSDQCAGEKVTECEGCAKKSHWGRPTTALLSRGAAVSQNSGNNGVVSMLREPTRAGGGGSCRTAECNATGCRHRHSTGENNNVRRGLWGTAESCPQKDFSCDSDVMESITSFLGTRPLHSAANKREDSEHSRDSLNLQLSDTEDQNSRSEIQSFFSAFSAARQAASQSDPSQSQDRLAVVSVDGMIDDDLLENNRVEEIDFLKV